MADWILRDDWVAYCDHCKAILEGDQLKYSNNYYCYHCGAKMINVFAIHELVRDYEAKNSGTEFTGENY